MYWWAATTIAFSAGDMRSDASEPVHRSVVDAWRELGRRGQKGQGARQGHAALIQQRMHMHPCIALLRAADRARAPMSVDQIRSDIHTQKHIRKHL